jgi:hypothetical protein
MMALNAGGDKNHLDRSNHLCAIRSCLFGTNTFNRV